LYRPCGQALQRAIEAAMAQRRSLRLPAGTYRINATLSVPSNADKAGPFYGHPGPASPGHRSHSTAA
jgi:hypothetical protein